LEIRQDLLLEESQQDFWARHIADGLKDLLVQPDLFVKRGVESSERHE
jgi:predicted N-formylglutamate amidohydrolase